MTTTEQQLQLIKKSIKTIVGYPKDGILYRDITSLLEDPVAFTASINLITEHLRGKGITKIVGTEARGFLFGTPVALALGVGFVPVRKPGKLPRETISQAYDLEYGSDTLEMHIDAITSNDKVAVIDDLLATGGTLSATIALIRKLGGQVNDAAFIIELPELNGKDRLTELEIECYSLVTFDGH